MNQGFSGAKYIEDQNRKKRVAALAVLIFISTLALILIPSGETAPTLTAPTSNEAFESWNSLIKLDPSGSLFVVEEMKLRIAGIKIKRGFCRELETSVVDSQKNKRNLVYEFDWFINRGDFTKTRSDGAAKNSASVCFGKEIPKDKPLAPSVYAYSLSYKVDLAAVSLSEWDELHKDLTGKLPVPLNSFSGQLVLPSGRGEDPKITIFSRREFFLPGEIRDGKIPKLEDFESIKVTKVPSNDSSQTYQFQGRRPFLAGERLVLDVRFPKGTIDRIVQVGR